MRNAAEARVRYAADPTIGRDAARRYRAADPERAAEIDRRHHLKVTYGLTPEGFDALVESQNGVCAICEGPPRGPGKCLHVDHDHETGKIRGLLCAPCNTAIGLLAENPERVRAMLAYLVGKKVQR